MWLNGCSSSTASTDPAPELTAGNTVFMTTFADVVSKVKTATGVSITSAQAPKTIVLTCSDSRVPPELIFNKTLGDLFVIRVAGNVLDKDQLASIEYAVEHNWATKIIILGHSQCGAVKEAVVSWKNTKSATYVPVGTTKMENLDYLVGKIYPRVIAARAAFPTYTSLTASGANLWEAAVDNNTDHIYEQLVLENEIVKEALADSSKALKNVIKAKYDITTGKVTFQ